MQIATQGRGWRLNWRELSPARRSAWWAQLWDEAIKLHDRYPLVLRSAWWEDEIQVDAPAALAGCCDRLRHCAWNDPIGKRLLLGLDRVHGLLHAGRDVFDPDRDRPTFGRHLLGIGCERD